MTCLNFCPVFDKCPVSIVSSMVVHTIPVQIDAKPGISFSWHKVGYNGRPLSWVQESRNLTNETNDVHKLHVHSQITLKACRKCVCCMLDFSLYVHWVSLTQCSMCVQLNTCLKLHMNPGTSPWFHLQSEHISSFLQTDVHTYMKVVCLFTATWTALW